MAVLEVIATTLAGRVGGAIWDTAAQAIEDWQQGRSMRQGGQLSLSISANGRQNIIPTQNGVMQAAPYLSNMYPQIPPIHLGGRFYADPDFVDYAEDILDNEEKEVLILIVDEDTDEFVVGSFSFTGYSISVPAGLYTVYAFIIDPLLDEFLAIGYPIMGRSEADPNPIELTGSGPLQLDFMLYEDLADELYDDDWDD